GKRSCSKQKRLRRDDDRKKSHPALTLTFPPAENRDNCRDPFYRAEGRHNLNKTVTEGWAATAHARMASLLSRKVETLVHAVGVLVVDDNQFMRKVVRNLLVNVGVRTVYEAADGVSGLEAIRTFAPDIVILDWEMPLLDG